LLINWQAPILFPHYFGERMKTYVLDSFGATTPFREQQQPRPIVDAGQVLIRVKASSINPADYKARELGHLLDFVPELPAQLGIDVSGIIDEVGPGVTKFAKGDKVFGCVGGVKGLPGTLAEWVVADARLIAHAPSRIPLAESAALPLIAITAWEGIVDPTQVRPGERVLIFGGSGNVGRMAIQLAKLQGSFVVSLDYPGRSEAAEQAGADVAVTTETPLNEVVQAHTAGKGFDVVFDTIGGDNLTRAFTAARLEGRVVTTIGLATIDLTQMHTKALSLRVIYMLTPLLHNVDRERHGKILTVIADLVDRGLLTPPLNAHRFKFDQVTEAYNYAQSSRTPGKVIIELS